MRKDSATSNAVKNTLILAILGLVLSVVVVIVQRLTDDTVRTGSDIANGLGIEVLGAIHEEENKGHILRKNKKKYSMCMEGKMHL